MSILVLNSKANMTQTKYWTGDSFIATQLGAHCRSVKHKIPTLLCWEKPEKGALKLNIDASFKDGRGGYGGILRNDQGELVIAMGLEGKCETPLDAEIQALSFCLQECIARGYKEMGVEIDSLQLVQMIQGKITHWKVQNKISRIAALLAVSLYDVLRGGVNKD
ncbi:hypothetical protein LIER_35588 [Lithospermum erythrorhizon]|uniref:RNase H type-1 domain-containing protein n=1 Tax=Lithospermum erythrorhizon TaxID=34254 RepID=A0AAV3NVV0_LITER